MGEPRESPPNAPLSRSAGEIKLLLRWNCDATAFNRAISFASCISFSPPFTLPAYLPICVTMFLRISLNLCHAVLRIFPYVSVRLHLLICPRHHLRVSV